MLRILGCLIVALTTVSLNVGRASAQDHGPPAAGEGAPDHGDHGIGHEGVSSDPGEIKTDLAVFTFVVFLLLLAILWKFAWGPISAGLDKREQGIAANIAAAQASHDQAKVMLAEYEKKLNQAQVEVRAILDEARRDAEHTQQEILAKARADAHTERDRALREIQTATDQALKELGERSANLAVNLAGKIVRQRLSAADHAQLIEEAVARFPRSSGQISSSAANN